MDRPSYVVSAEQVHHNNKNRNFIRIILFLIGIIVLLASIFVLTIIYRTLKSGIKRKVWKKNLINLNIFRNTKKEFNNT